MHPLAENVGKISRVLNFFPGSGIIIVAVSGGIDSMVQTAAIVVAIVSALGVGVILMQPEKKTLVEEEQP